MTVAQYNLSIASTRDADLKRDIFIRKGLTDIPTELFNECLSFLKSSDKMKQYELEWTRFIWISLASKTPGLAAPLIHESPNSLYLERFAQVCLDEINKIYNDYVPDRCFSKFERIENIFSSPTTCQKYLKGEGKGPLRRLIFKITTLSIGEININHCLNFKVFNKLKRVEMIYTQTTAEQINQLPLTVEDLTIIRVDIKNFNFGRLNSLKRLCLAAIENLSVEQWNQIPPDLETLILDNIDISPFSFKRFNLKKINLIFEKSVTGLTTEHFRELSPELKELSLRFPNGYVEENDSYDLPINEINLSFLTQLETFSFSMDSYYRFRHCYPANQMIATINPNIKILKLTNLDLTGVSFNRFLCLENLSLIHCSGIMPAFIPMFPKTIKSLYLKGFDFEGWDISLFIPFIHLEILQLVSCKNIDMIVSSCISYPKDLPFELWR